MNSQVLLWIEPLVLIGLAGIVYLIWKSAQAKKHDRAMRDKTMEVAERFIEAVGKLGEVTVELRTIPKIIDGNLKVCTAMVEEVAKLRVSVHQFRSLIMQPTDPKQALATPTDEEKNSVFDIASLLTENPGMDWQDAASRVKSNQDRAAMFSGVSAEEE